MMRLTEQEYSALIANKTAKRAEKVQAIEAMPKAAVKVDKPKRKGYLASIAVFLPIKLISEMNASEHWSKYAERNKKQQEEFKIEWYRLTRNAKIELPCLVKFTRIGQKRLDPGNCEASFKHVQDALCYCLGVDDGDTERIRFEYAQEATGKREYGVRVEISKITVDTK